MNGFFKAASLFSFLGAVAFIYVLIQSGRFAFVGMIIVMLCNGISFWEKSLQRESDIAQNEESTEE
jgi:hypothetical protein